MSDSVREALMKKLVVRFGEIIQGNETESGSGIIYTNTIITVQRFEMAGQVFAKANLPAIVVVPIENDIEDLNQAQLMSTFRVAAQCWTRHDKTVFADSTDELLNSLLADMQKAVLKDRTFGDEVDDTDILGDWPFEPESGEPLVGVNMDLEIRIRQSNKDPDLVVYP